jgi:hypothetical protein
MAGVTLARRLSARARHRGAVLLPFGSWPGADLELSASAMRWTGLGSGHGHLTGCELVVTAEGRGAAARPVRTTMHLPSGFDSGPVRPLAGASELATAVAG